MVSDPFGMRGKDLRPGSVLGKIPVSKPSHNVELTFNQVWLVLSSCETSDESLWQSMQEQEACHHVEQSLLQRNYQSRTRAPVK